MSGVTLVKLHPRCRVYHVYENGLVSHTFVLKRECISSHNTTAAAARHCWEHQDHPETAHVLYDIVIDSDGHNYCER